MVGGGRQRFEVVIEGRGKPSVLFGFDGKVADRLFVRVGGGLFLSTLYGLETGGCGWLNCFVLLRLIVWK